MSDSRPISRELFLIVTSMSRSFIPLQISPVFYHAVVAPFASVAFGAVFWE